jgi:hypothetical protein
MNRTDFTLALEQELQLCSIPFSRAELLAFVAGAWPLIEDDPDVTYWARKFIGSGRASATA